MHLHVQVVTQRGHNYHWDTVEEDTTGIDANSDPYSEKPHHD